MDHAASPASPSPGRFPRLKEDWWAVIVGLGVVALAIALAKAGSPALKDLAVNPGSVKWTQVGQLGDHFAANWGKYLVQCVVFSAVLGGTLAAMGVSFRRFLVGFLFLYALSLGAFCAGGWAHASEYNLETPLVALVGGLLLANCLRLPRILDEAFRVEYFVKLGVVMLGATFPLALVLSAGPVAIGQAAIISLLTAGTIYFFAVRVFGLDRRLGAVLCVGGAVCGVSGSMAIAASVGAKREHLYAGVSLVVVGALVMIVALPLVSKAMGLPAGVGGAWIGTSEFADAAGFAASSAYGKMAGNEEAAIKAFTLMKVIGRDLWIGIWSLFFAVLATTRWEKQEGVAARPGAGEIWRRLPKFVLGFFAASLAVSWVTAGMDAAAIAQIKPALMKPLGELRGWTFALGFLAIGLSTRFRELKNVPPKAALAFAIGVAVNVVAGYILSVKVFGDYWAKL